MPHFLTDAQFHTLTALCDTLIPALEHPPDPHGFWQRRASDLDVPKRLTKVIRNIQSEDLQTQFKWVLDGLNHPITAGFLTGYFRPFAELPFADREKTLQRWAVSPLPQLRLAFQALKRLTGVLFYGAEDATGRNPNWATIQYPGAPFSAPSTPPIIPTITLEQDTTLTCDVVVIGSGAGGGVVAGELARAGKDVIVLEKGGYYHEADFDGREYASYEKLYENQGALATRDLSVTVLAGATLGGGTTINWAAAFRPPAHVLEEWERVYSCVGYTGAAFQASLDAVCARLNVTTDESTPNAEALTLERGCRALDYHWGVVPRNVRGCGDCGWCGFGCPLGAKQSTLKTYLHDAAEAGARFVVNAQARRIIVEHGQAVGVEAVVKSRTLTVKAKSVVVAAGALHTPALLLRSGLSHPHLGRNLYLHPTAVVFGKYTEPIESWHGVMIARYSDQFSNLDGQNYGVTIEHPPAHPALIGLGMPWRSARQYKQQISEARHYAAFIVLTRDRFGGQVTLDRRKRPRLDYALAPYDARHLQRGLAEAFRIHAAAGAHEINGPHSGLEPYIRGDNLDDYVRKLTAFDFAPNKSMLFSAHQMGTCRMGGNRAQAVLSPDGAVWNVGNLYVADASTFPTPSGVNPMITIMAVAHRIAQAIKSRNV